MIDRSQLPPISEILSALGARLQRRRASGICHGSETPGVISYDDDRGVYYCHRCGHGGDVIDLVRRTRDLDYRGACQWLGIAPGRPAAPDPEALRRRRIREGLRAWARRTAKELSYEHYVRERVIAAAERRLRRDAQDEWAWRWLAWAYVGLDGLDHKLDLLSGTEAALVEAYKHMRGGAA